MDRLIKPDVQELNLFFTKGQKCSIAFNLTNLMHTMSVAVSLTTTNPSKFSFSQAFSLISPLSTSSFTLSLNQPCDQPPLSMPPETVLVRSSMLPTGKAHQDELQRLFSKPGLHIFKDATIPISFVGPDVVEFLLSPLNKSLEVNFLFSKAIFGCDESQLSYLLRFAAKNGNSYFVSSLIEAGADVNERDLDGESALSMAVRSGNADSVQFLIESGSTIDNKTDRVLHEAAGSGRVDLMEILCLGYIDIDLNSLNSHNQTALHIAAINGHVETFQFLVSVGSDPDITDSDGWTPLHYAAHEGRTEAVEFLLNHSFFAKYALTKDGKTAYSLAVENGHSHLYDVLHLGDMLHRAARMDDVHTMKSCLALGGKVNGRDQYGWTPLHRAAYKGHIESVKLLVSHGARVDLVDGTGYTPLLRAVEAGHVEVAMYLLSCGAKANLKSLKGVAPSDLECFKKYSSLLSPLQQEDVLKL